MPSSAIWSTTYLIPGTVFWRLDKSSLHLKVEFVPHRGRSVLAIRRQICEFWFLVLGILHGVRAERPDDVSGAAVDT